MGLRLYLRGLGLGIIVTALLMGYTLGNKKESLTDAEIIARAEALGMVEEGKQLFQPSDSSEETIEVTGRKDEDTGDVAASTGTDAPVTGTEEQENPVTGTEEQEDSVTGTEEASEKPEEGVNGESVKELNVSGAVESGEEVVAGGDDQAPADVVSDDSKEPETTTPRRQTRDVTLTIRGGSDSLTIARQLENLGAVESAEDFDAYLVSRKLDRYISSGTFSIPARATREEIAKIITGR